MRIRFLPLHSEGAAVTYGDLWTMCQFISLDGKDLIKASDKIANRKLETTKFATTCMVNRCCRAGANTMLVHTTLNSVQFCHLICKVIRSEITSAKWSNLLGGCSTLYSDPATAGNKKDSAITFTNTFLSNVHVKYTRHHLFVPEFFGIEKGTHYTNKCLATEWIIHASCSRNIEKRWFEPKIEWRTQ